MPKIKKKQKNKPPCLSCHLMWDSWAEGPTAEPFEPWLGGCCHMPSFLGKEGLLQLRDPGPLPGGGGVGACWARPCKPPVTWSTSAPRYPSAIPRCWQGYSTEWRAWSTWCSPWAPGMVAAWGAVHPGTTGARGVPCGLLPQHSFLLQCPSLRALKHQI